MATQPSGSEAMFWAGVEHAGKFFMGDADVNHALRKLVAALAEVDVPYAIVGAMALNEYGYRRVTTGVDVLLTPRASPRSRLTGSGAATSRSSLAARACATPRTV